MRLTGLRVQNFRSIVDSGEMRIEPFQAFVGENNSGKSNLLRAVQVMLTSGAAGVSETSFFDPETPIRISATFGALEPSERRRLRPYLLGDKLILEKVIYPADQAGSGKGSASAQYHGYVAKPKEWWLSTDGVLEHEDTQRPQWERIAKEHDILDYVRDRKTDRVTKQSYEAGLRQLIIEREDIEFEEPTLGETQALGLQPALLKELPLFRLLPAVTDYSNETDRRSSQTNFRLLMGDLADRIIKTDLRYAQLERSIRELTALFNAPKQDEKRAEGQERLAVLAAIEDKLRVIISKVMPSVRGVLLDVEIEEVNAIFSRGVSIQVDDGKLTEVLMKGHGLQRCVVFGLIQALILNQRGELVDLPEQAIAEIEKDTRRIILGIEEPELYIHPQMQRLVHGVLKDFADSDQVLYTTHSPAFVDVGNYECIALTRKDSITEGTRTKQCSPGVLDAENERKTFQFIASFGLEQNTMFFARKVILVEGPEDEIAILAAGRKLGLFREFPEELGTTIVQAAKQELPKFMKLLNGFEIPFGVLHELDGNPEAEENKRIEALLGANKRVTLPQRLEDAVGHHGHFHKTYDAMKFFEDPGNITKQLEDATVALFS